MEIFIGIVLAFLAASLTYNYLLIRDRVTTRKAFATTLAKTHVRHYRNREQLNRDNEVLLELLKKSFDQGMEEQEENYQQMMLEQYDTLAVEISNLTHKNKILGEWYEFHNANCLPHLTDIRLASAIEAELQDRTG